MRYLLLLVLTMWLGCGGNKESPEEWKTDADIRRYGDRVEIDSTFFNYLIANSDSLRSAAPQEDYYSLWLHLEKDMQELYNAGLGDTIKKILGDTIPPDTITKLSPAMAVPAALPDTTIDPIRTFNGLPKMTVKPNSLRQLHDIDLGKAPHDIFTDSFGGWVDRDVVWEPIETVYVHDTVYDTAKFFQFPKYNKRGQRLYYGSYDDSVLAKSRGHKCLYSTEAAVCKVRGHTEMSDGMYSFRIGGYSSFTCQWCNGKYKTQPVTTEVSPPTK